MSRTDRTPTLVEVTKIDLTPVEEHALAYLRDKAQFDRDHGQDARTPSAVGTGHKWGIVACPDGSLYALCTEGVGTARPVTDDSPLEVDVYVRYEGDSAGGIISMFPAATAQIGPDDLRKYATGERVNLAEFIRTFGHRLDSNYESYRRLFVNEGVASE